MEFVANYGLFLAKIVTVVIAILAIVGGLVAILSKDKVKNKLSIKKLNERFDDMASDLHKATLTKDELKKVLKESKLQAKQRSQKSHPRIFVLNFNGDIKASGVNALREEITAILTIAHANDEVFLRLESGGGLVHSYGLAASQLQRFRDHEISLTIAIDKVAASGGYMMACVANHIISAPFAIIGSIGVLAQLPNFHRWLKKNDIDFEQMTAGKFKRTVTMFGENTSQAREKFQEELEETHTLFKDFIHKHRNIIDIDNIATGEHWLGTRAKELKLVDEILTSDDYLLKARENHDLYEVKYSRKKKLGEKISTAVSATLSYFPTNASVKMPK